MIALRGPRPLLVQKGATRWGLTEVREIIEMYEALWARDERFAIVVLYDREAAGLGAEARRLLIKWLNEPHVQRASREYCVGSSSVIASPLARGALTAMMWFWRPPCPFHVARTPEEAIEWCLDRSIESGVIEEAQRSSFRAQALDAVRELTVGDDANVHA